MLPAVWEEHGLSLLEIQGNVKEGNFSCEHYTYYNPLIIRVLLF